VILSVFVVPMFLNFSKRGIVTMLTLITSGVITVVLNKISTGKLAVLRTFILALSLILAMASAVLWSAVIPG
jgi:hypothetical protein